MSKDSVQSHDTASRSLLEIELQRKDKLVRVTYWLAGAAVCLLVVYELFIKG